MSLIAFAQHKVRLPDLAAVGNEILVRPSGSPDSADAYYAALRDKHLDLRLLVEHESALVAVSAVASFGGRPTSINLSWPYLRSWYGRKTIDRLSVIEDPRSVTIELLEGDSVGDDVAVDTVCWLRDFGFKVAIDDFGKGHSDRHRLKTLPYVDEVKFDGGLIQRGLPVEQMKELVELVHEKGALATAEWVESKADLDYVQACGFDTAQGYYFGKPKSM